MKNTNKLGMGSSWRYFSMDVGSEERRSEGYFKTPIKKEKKPKRSQLHCASQPYCCASTPNNPTNTTNRTGRAMKTKKSKRKKNENEISQEILILRPK